MRTNDKKCGIILVLFFLALRSYSQGNYQPGYLILNTNDTIHGFIDFASDAKNAQQCNFKKDEKSEPQLFLPKDITGYRFGDTGLYYVSRDVVIEGEKDTVFLEFLVQGILNLYYYANNNKDYFFFEDDQGNMNTISRNLNSDDYVENNKYKNTIRYLFREYPPIIERANQLKFDQKSMIKITKTYHDNVCTTGEECIVYVNNQPDKSWHAFKFSLYAGLQQSTFNFAIIDKINGKFIKYKHSRNLSPVIGGQVNLLYPRLSKSLSFQLDMSLSQFKNTTSNTTYYTVTKYDEKFDYKSLSLSCKLGFKYVFLQEKKFRPTVEAGIAYNRFLNDSFTKYDSDVISIIDDSEFKYSSIDYEITKSRYGMYAAIGADYMLKNENSVFIRLSLDKYLKDGLYVSRENDYIDIIQLKVGYTF